MESPDGIERLFNVNQDDLAEPGNPSANAEDRQDALHGLDVQAGKIVRGALAQDVVFPHAGQALYQHQAHVSHRFHRMSLSLSRLGSRSSRYSITPLTWHSRPSYSCPR